VTNIPAPGIDPPDRIELRGLRALGSHGVLPEERQRPQPFEVDLDLEVDLAPAGDTDDLAATVDYGEVIERVADVVGGSRSYQLLETLAGVVASAALVDERVVSVTVGIRKLRPPVSTDVRSVGVRITRRR
jgi:dihydroneopterin aldolase